MTYTMNRNDYFSDLELNREQRRALAKAKQKLIAGYPDKLTLVDENDPKQWIGKLCLFWDECAPDGRKVIGFLSNYMDERKSPFYEATGNNWMCCRPATREEVEQYLVKEN